MTDYFLRHYKTKHLFHDPFHPTNTFIYEMFRQFIFKLTNHILPDDDPEFVKQTCEMTTWAQPILPQIIKLLDMQQDLFEYCYKFEPPKLGEKMIYINIYDYYYIRLSTNNFDKYLSKLK